VVRHLKCSSVESQRRRAPTAAFKHILSIGVVASILTGCEANLDMTGIDATLEQPIRRTDQFLALERTPSGGLLAFADDGVVVEGQLSRSGIVWTRQTLEADRLPTFIDSAACADGSVVGLSFYNEIWWFVDSTWRMTPIETFEQLESVDCRADNEVWVAGSFSSFYRTQDLGETWEDLSIGEDATVTNLQFVNDEVGYAVGEFGMVFQTTDGGEQWAVVEPVADEFYPLSLHFSDPQRGWVGGVLGIIFATEDGGATWVQQESEGHAAVYGFIESKEGLFAFGDQGSFLKLENRVWRSQPAPSIPIHYKAGVALESGEALLVGGWGLTMVLPLASSGDENQMVEGSK
jgi:hypothetical protein